MSKDKFINNVPDFDFIVTDDGLEYWRDGRKWSYPEMQNYYKARTEQYHRKNKSLSPVEMMILAGRQKQPTITEPTIF